MDLLLHLAGAIIGVTLVAVFFRSLVRVALINRRPDDVILNLAGLVTALLFIRRPADLGDKKRLDAHGLWYWPLSQLILIALWLIIVVSGFACLYLAFGSVPTVERALIASGSALSTLGFGTPRDPIGEALSMIEGLIGLGIVVFVFTFIPGYLSTIRSRDDQVAWVYARTDGDPTGSGILEWLVAAERTDRLAEVWQSWESWFRHFGETHALSPLLAFDRSLRRGQSWVAAVGAMLDATAFAVSALEVAGDADAEVCLRTGTRALEMIAEAMSPAMRKLPSAVPEPELDRASFDALRARLAAAGVRCRPDIETAFLELHARRAGYLGLVVRLGMVVSPGQQMVGWSLRTERPVMPGSTSHGNGSTGHA